MPVTYRECLSRVIQMLGEPHPVYPSEPAIWRALADAAQHLFNQAMNSPVAWSISSIDLDVVADQDEYLLPAPDFGKDVLIETVDPTDPNHVPRPVRRMSLQSSLIGGYDLYAERYGSLWLTGVKHTVQTMALYRKDGAVYIRTLPKPPVGAQTAKYRVWYERMEANTDSDANNFIVPAGVPLLCARAAFTVLPHAQWSGFNDAQNANKRKELAVTISSDKTDYEREWKRYLATDRQPGVTSMRGFDDASYQADYWGY